MQLIKCNKCDFLSPNEEDFSVICFYMPEKRQSFNSISERWDELSKKYEKAELLSYGFEDMKENEEPHAIIHLCQKHTDWFAALFSPQPVRPMAEKKQLVKRIAHKKKKTKTKN